MNLDFSEDSYQTVAFCVIKFGALPPLLMLRCYLNERSPRFLPVRKLSCPPDINALPEINALPKRLLKMNVQGG